MAARIKIEVRKIRGPWLDIVKELVKQGDVMAVITAHRPPRLGVPPHTPKPEVFPGVWKLTPYAKESAGGVKLIAIQAELLPQNLEGVDGAVGRWRFKLMVNKSGIGFFEIEAIAVVSNGDIATAEELMEVLDQEPVVGEVLFVTRIVWEGLDRYLATALPAVREA